MTQAMRENEAAKKAQKIGPVRIRVILPDRLVLQATFKATDRLSDLMVCPGLRICQYACLTGRLYCCMTSMRGRICMASFLLVPMCLHTSQSLVHTAF